MMAITSGDVTSIALCWRLERADGAGIALTSHDGVVISEGVSHSPSPGMSPASVTRTAGLDPHSGEVGGAISSDALDASDLELGRWDGAKASLSAVNWDNDSDDPIQLLGGEIGSVSITGAGFTAELLGAANRLDGPVCPATSAECRAEFGDRACRVDLAGRAAFATVISSDANGMVLDRAFDDRFVLGRLRFMSGANCGLSTVIMAVDGAAITIRDVPRRAVGEGERVELREGCDKRFDTCVSRFANGVNFRGEPHLPGNDLLTRYPGA